VTVDKALTKCGDRRRHQYNGLAINGQCFHALADDFVTDGPIPVTSTFDHGYELSASYFVKPKS
jgi:hypothetical protein